MTRLLATVLIATIAIAVSSCQSDPTASRSLAAGIDSAVIPLGAYPFAAAPPADPAIVTGCTWTTELGETSGQWGTMQPGSGKAYPNPTNGSVVMTMALPTDNRVVWWLTRAYGPGETVPETSSQHAGGTVIIPSPVLFGPFERHFAVGIQFIQWDGEDNFGSPVEEGYYRMYVHVPDPGWTGWWDVLVDRD